MSSRWKEEYSVSLKDVELSNPVNMELVQTCSQMADRIAVLEAEKAALEAGDGPSYPKEKNSSAPTAALDPADPGVAQLRLEIAEALRSKGAADVRLRAAEEELIKLRAKTKKDTKIITSLDTERAGLTTKLKDRDHELREKRKLLEHVQDEMIALNLQVSMVEKERDKVQKENKDLVDRWMKRMAQEVDAMNLANEPHLEPRK